MKLNLLVVFVVLLWCVGSASGQFNSQRVIYTSANPPTVCVPGKLYTNNGLLIKSIWLGLSDSSCQRVDAGASPATTPGGSNTQVQFNDSSAFGGDAGLVYNKTTDTLTAIHLIGSTDLSIGAGSAITSSGAGGALGSLSFVTPGTGVATALGINVGSAGAFVTNGGALGTPSSGTLTSATGLPIATGVSGLGTGVATFLATPSGANLASALTTALPVSKGGTNCTSATITCFNNITGFSAAGSTGTTSTNLVFSTSPTLVTPTLGAATATSLNGNTFTTGTYTLTGTAGKTLNFTNTLTLSGTDSTVMTFPTTSATIARTDAANTFTGVQTMTSPALTTPAITTSATITRNSLGTTATDGLILANTTTGSQQYSPRIRFSGRSAADQATDFDMVSTGGSVAPVLVFSAQQNGGGYLKTFTIQNNGAAGNNYIAINSPTSANSSVLYTVNDVTKWVVQVAGNSSDQFRFLGSDAIGNPSLLEIANATTGAIKFGGSNYTTCTALTTAANVVTCTVSDERVKSHINRSPFGPGNSLDILRKIQPITFQYRQDTAYYNGGRTQLGLSAQNLREASPLLVSSFTHDGETLLQPEGMAIHSLELDVLKRLDARITALEKENARLRQALRRHKN